MPIIYSSYAHKFRRWLEERHATETEIPVGFCDYAVICTLRSAERLSGPHAHDAVLHCRAN